MILGGVGGVPTDRKLYKATSLDILMKRDSNYMKWRDAVLARDGGCVVCPEYKKKLKNCNVHHIIPKNFIQFALNVDNGIGLCPSHHTLGRYSAHKHPIWWVKWMRRNRLGTLQLAEDRMEDIDDI